ncbi:phosphonate ABC transporter, permease protein PhnE [Aquabacterium sp.]|uniref:phosphonate ABC transporter, permease protein PhnE n=1 Tax=Aquabacterium sp. TaxID=1872578 RepID=UPI002C2E804F|nr:phosphonate ABC transporter, permease protein PhnE [Aquabacterium sp.]HSW08115.1 phosphonate ABC transporter, permease protein PhnE [Aquabacterium sp.]
MAAPPPRRQAWLFAAGLAALVGASFATLDLKWADFLSPGALASLLKFAASFFPPQLAPGFLAKTGAATLETLAMSIVGTALATLFGLLLALPASGRGHAGALALRGLARGLLNVLRSIPELVWASLLLIAAGLGPFPGALALALHTTGVLGRLFAESIENAAPEPAFALRVRGLSALRVFLFATLPQVGPQLLSYTLYRWENNIRAAAVLGVVGAGGLGQMLYYHLGLFHMRESCTVLIAMILMVAVVDALSWAARRALER